jgi:hypothetical protein
MGQHKTTALITGDKFVAGLLERGIVDDRTRKVTIVAEVGQPITLTIEEFGDGRLLKLLEGGDLVITEDPQEAMAR